MKSDILLVSSLLPTKCGVATYAQEHLMVLRESGLQMTTASPDADSVADIHFTTFTLKGALRWLRFCGTHRFEIVHVHYVDRFFFSYGRYGPIRRILLRILQSLALRFLASRSFCSYVVVHEFATSPNLGKTYFRWRDFGLSAFTNVQFHTQSMKEDFLRVCYNVSRKRCRLVAHERFMRRHYLGNKETARKILSLPINNTIFICLGFIQESKGFDDVVSAFGECGLNAKTELHVVGSLQVNHPDITKYAANLKHFCQSVPNCYFHGKFLSDEEFDCWLAAADLLFLPYRGVASSGVGARAQLYKCPIVIRSLPNLIDQFPAALKFSVYEELHEIMKSNGSGFQ